MDDLIPRLRFFGSTVVKSSSHHRLVKRLQLLVLLHGYGNDKESASKVPDQKATRRRMSQAHS